MKKLLIMLCISALLLTGANCGGTKPNPKPKPKEGPSWINPSPCKTAPVDCPLQTGRQPAPTGSAK